jgi:hypothetical protein
MLVQRRRCGFPGGFRLRPEGIPPMLYIASVHYMSPRWIEIQSRYLREHISVEYQTWTSLEGIDPAYGRHFDRVLEQRGLHASKLNNLALEISQEASEGDLLMFLDGDAFPIADPMPLVSSALAEAPLVAVRRAENFDQPQPHPCFCVTTVGTWHAIHGDWCAGYPWPARGGRLTSDVGGNLMRTLELSNTPWVQVLRSNHHQLDPLYYGIYGKVIYHHGAGFRTGGLSPAHRSGPPPLPLSHVPVIGAAGKLLNGLRWRRWERDVEARHVRQSQEIYDEIKAGGSDWLAELDGAA